MSLPDAGSFRQDPAKTGSLGLKTAFIFQKFGSYTEFPVNGHPIFDPGGQRYFPGIAVSGSFEKHPVHRDQEIGAGCCCYKAPKRPG
jgi:hypothetical protein